MKKRFEMPSAEAFKALYPQAGERYETAVRNTLRGLDENEEVKPVMKKKLSLGFVLVMILVLLACAALAVSGGAFKWFADLSGDSGTGKLYTKLDENSLPGEGTKEIAAATDSPYQALELSISQSYYDGESLYLAYSMKGAQNVYDYTWLPTSDELSHMEKVNVDGVTKDQDSALCIDDQAFLNTMVETAKRDGKAGCIQYSSYLSDGVYLAGTDIYLDLEMSDDRFLTDGTLMGVKQFASPLCDEARGKDALSLVFKLYRAPTRHYFDGENWYILWGERTETPMAFTVQRNDYSASVVYPINAESPGYSVSGTATLSSMVLRLDLALQTKTGAPVLPDEWGVGSMTYLNLYMDGVPLEQVDGSGSESGVGTQVCYYQAKYFRPDADAKLLTIVPVYREATTGDADADFKERAEETITIDLTKLPAPTALPHAAV